MILLIFKYSYFLNSYVINKFVSFLVPPNNNERSEFLVGLEKDKFHVCIASGLWRCVCERALEYGLADMGLCLSLCSRLRACKGPTAA
jgi:hypothetical protein